MPMSDVLIITAEELCPTLLRSAPENEETKEIVETLTNIYKIKAAKERSNEDTQRVLRKIAQAQKWLRTEKKATYFWHPSSKDQPEKM